MQDKMSLSLRMMEEIKDGLNEIGAIPARRSGRRARSESPANPSPSKKRKRNNRGEIRDEPFEDPNAGSEEECSDLSSVDSALFREDSAAVAGEVSDQVASVAAGL
jgi:hypothetical protein